MLFIQIPAGCKVETREDGYFFTKEKEDICNLQTLVNSYFKGDRKDLGVSTFCPRTNSCYAMVTTHSQSNRICCIWKDSIVGNTWWKEHDAVAARRSAQTPILSVTGTVTEVGS